MTRYTRLENDAPAEWGLTLADLRRRLPNVSIPAANPPAAIGDFVAYAFTDAPEVDITKNVTEGPPALVDGEWVMQWVVTDAPPEEAAARLAALREDLKRQVDAEAEQQRKRYVTPGEAQQAVYLLKREEAERWFATYAEAPAEDPPDEDWPMLAAEVGITAPTKHEVALTIRALAQQWTQAAAMIETLRLAAKRAIDEAEDEAAMRAAADIDWSGLPAAE